VNNEAYSAEEVVEYVAARRREIETKQDEAFYRDLAKYVPIESK